MVFKKQFAAPCLITQHLLENSRKINLVTEATVSLPNNHQSFKGVISLKMHASPSFPNSVYIFYDTSFLFLILENYMTLAAES